MELPVIAKGVEFGDVLFYWVIEGGMRLMRCR